MLGGMIEHHADSSFTQFEGVLAGSPMGSALCEWLLRPTRYDSRRPRPKRVTTPKYERRDDSSRELGDHSFAVPTGTRAIGGRHEGTRKARCARIRTYRAATDRLGPAACA